MVIDHLLRSPKDLWSSQSEQSAGSILSRDASWSFIHPDFANPVDFKIFNGGQWSLCGRVPWAHKLESLKIKLRTVSDSLPQEYEGLGRTLESYWNQDASKDLHYNSLKERVVLRKESSNTWNSIDLIDQASPNS